MCNDPTCPICRRKREEEQVLDLCSEIVGVIDSILRQSTPEEVDKARTEAHKGRKFTVTGPKNGRNDFSYVGCIFEVISFCSHLVVARPVCDDRGRTKDWIFWGKNRTIDLNQYNTRPVTDAHVRALRGY